MAIRIGTAGWAIPRSVADEFPSEGSSLERYASRFDVAEINSSFHRAHRQDTWSRWHDSVPDRFRFSLKLPKEITHRKKLLDCSAGLESFIEQVRTLGEKLAVILVQLPPKLQFDPAVAEEFFASLRALSGAAIVCEPRHISWFSPEVNERFEAMRVARAAADPSICPEARRPGGWAGIKYWRLHGSPVMYRSSYEGRLSSYAEELKAASGRGEEVWCIFDNTASSAATADALALLKLTGRTSSGV
jgi:uncharacterized protein YecE (DUF72 family)